MQELVNIYFGVAPGEDEARKLKKLISSDSDIDLSNYFSLANYDEIDAAWAYHQKAHKFNVHPLTAVK